MGSFQLETLSPVLFVEEIEPCLPFWMEQLGFAKVAEVPEGKKLGFAMLVKDGVTVMYQSRASVAKDVPAMAGDPSHAHLFIRVKGIEEIIRRLEGAPVVVPVRTTFYGAKEIGVREPGGNVVIFAEFAESEK
jgi:uncharacterized glyoxalase superfamily protein PhnB